VSKLTHCLYVTVAAQPLSNSLAAISLAWVIFCFIKWNNGAKDAWATYASPALGIMAGWPLLIAIFTTLEWVGITRNGRLP
jgi:hypothetical protein